MKSLLIFLFVVTVVFACDKKKEPAPAPPPEPEPVVPVSPCKDLPPPPEPFGWYDSTGNTNENVNAFIMNPANPDEVICVVNGDAFGYNKMLTYNIPLKQSKYLAALGNYLPSINKFGWIVYSTSDYNIYKIKTNGDSLTQLTSGNVNEDPKWDHTGKYIYHYRRAFSSLPSQLIKINATGGSVFSMPVEIPYSTPFKNSDKIIYHQTTGSVVTLVQRNMTTQVETQLITGPYVPNSDNFYFDNLTVDKTDENLYWSNSFGIFRYNLKTLKTDTVLKNCPNIIYNNPLISFNDNELTVSKHIMTPIDAYRLFHEYKAMELNTGTNVLTEIRIFQ